MLEKVSTLFTEERCVQVLRVQTHVIIEGGTRIELRCKVSEVVLIRRHQKVIVGLI